MSATAHFYADAQSLPNLGCFYPNYVGANDGYLRIFAALQRIHACYISNESADIPLSHHSRGNNFCKEFGWKTAFSYSGEILYYDLLLLKQPLVKFIIHARNVFSLY